MRYSHLLQISQYQRAHVVDVLLAKCPKLVSIIVYCLMPNHFHLLLKQRMDNGIALFMNRVSDGYTKYFNTKNKRVGPLMQGRFRSVMIESDEQLIHVSRYIHLNPFTSYIVKSHDQIFTYPWSSIHEYILSKQEICETQEIMTLFPNTHRYKEFIQDQADYQRHLDGIKHLVLE